MLYNFGKILHYSHISVQLIINEDITYWRNNRQAIWKSIKTWIAYSQWFWTYPFRTAAMLNLMEIIEDRQGKSSAMIISQIY